MVVHAQILFTVKKVIIQLDYIVKNLKLYSTQHIWLPKLSSLINQNRLTCFLSMIFHEIGVRKTEQVTSENFLCSEI